MPKFEVSTQNKPLTVRGLANFVKPFFGVVTCEKLRVGSVSEIEQSRVKVLPIELQLTVFAPYGEFHFTIKRFERGTATPLRRVYATTEPYSSPHITKQLKTLFPPESGFQNLPNLSLSRAWFE